MSGTQRAPFYWRGNFLPVPDEITAVDLTVRGEVPRQLRGTYLRNGPNPRNGDPGHWFFGDGMLHGVRLEDGQASWYRNRWVQTRCLLEDARFVGDDGTIDRTATKANTNIIAHAGRLYALAENAFPMEIGPNLETLGIRDFDARLTTAMTAHPKECPITGELHFFGYAFLPPFLVYHRLDRQGRLVESIEIDVPGPTMMHDFAITENYVLFFDLPVVFDLELAMGGSMPYRWSDTYGARIGVMPRAAGAKQVRWFEVEPCYVFHPFNAFERDGRVVVDMARYPELWRANSGEFKPARAHRWSIDQSTGVVKEEAMDDRAVEFPRIDDRRLGLSHRYGYAVANHDGVSEQSAALVRYDFERGTSEARDFGTGRSPGEGVFVPAGADAAEDDGFVMTYVYDQGRDASDLVLLDAANIQSEPIATIELPRRVPFGFHGNWIADR